ncbi:3-hydroxyacyl-CoA dehydrogenase NAD-binding domain-containing protein [Candidatus Moduliflexota bacterium]
MTGTFRIEESGGIAAVTFDLPGEKVNILRPDVLVEFEKVLGKLEKMAPGLKGVMILSGKEGNFVAGADIGIIGALSSPEKGRALAEEGQAVFDRLESFPLPVVAVIDGACLGGGLELALACTWRVASDSQRTFLGLPETLLGILPAFGGTQRLPRLTGLPEALRLITSGSRVHPAKALRIGLVDEVTVREHLRDAAEMLIARGRRDRGPKKPASLAGKMARFFLESNGYGRKLIFERARREVRERGGDHYPAPLAAIDAVEAGISGGMEKGLEREAQLLGVMAFSPVSKNLIHVFRLRERFSKVSAAPAAGIGRTGVVGAGVMGGGIAALAAMKGLRTRIMDLSPTALGGALRTVDKTLAAGKKKGAITGAEASWGAARITWDTEIRGLGGIDLVIEAVAERMDIKKSVLADVAARVGKDALILSNTSSLSITGMAEGVVNPSRVAGLHFFNPVDRMPLVEVIRGRETSEETVGRVKAFAKRLGKIPIVARDRPGFLVNRLLFPYLVEGARLLEEGAALSTVDGALEDFGMPMGPFALIDMVGADIASHAAANLREGLGDRFLAPALLGAMVQGGRLGRKTGSGFYLYGGKGKGKGRRSPGLDDFLSLHVKGGERDAPPREEIVDRLIFAMVNEASLCLEEGVVESPEAVDAGMILGAGFPPFTGGLLRYADSRGLREIADGLAKIHTSGRGDAPSDMIVKLASSGKGFHGL